MGSDPVYTSRQRAAVVRLRDDGKTGREIAEACAAGIDGLEPFDIPPQTAIGIARREKARRLDRELAAEKAGPVAASLIRRLIVLTQLEIDEMERVQKRGKSVDLGRADQAARLLERLHKAVTRAPTSPTSEKAPEPTDEHGRESGWMASLGDDDDASDRIGVGRASTDASPNGDGTAADRTSGDDSADEGEQGQQGR